MKLEITSTCWLTTGLRWTGKKEWLPQEGGLMANTDKILQASESVEGKYVVCFEFGSGYFYYIIIRNRKLTLVRVAGGEVFENEQFDPTLFKCNVYARIHSQKCMEMMQLILGMGIDKIAPMGLFNLSLVKWE
jgi:hypothetical protein